MGRNWRSGEWIWIFPVARARTSTAATNTRNKARLGRQEEGEDEGHDQITRHLEHEVNSRIYKGFSLPVHVEHVQPGHCAELLPPQGVTRHHARLAVGEGQQALVGIIHGGAVTLLLHLLPIEHTVVWNGDISSWTKGHSEAVTMLGAAVVTHQLGPPQPPPPSGGKHPPVLSWKPHS